MKSKTFLIWMAFATAAPLLSQVVHRRVEIAGPGGEVKTWVGESPVLADAAFVHGPGVRLEGPPKKGAPYSAEAVTETVQVLSDGNRITRESRAKVYRDSEGRTRREETLSAVGPWAVAGENQERVFLNDPVSGEHWILEPENKIARKMPVPRIADHIGAHGDSDGAVDIDVTVEVSDGGEHPGEHAGTVRRRVENREVIVRRSSPGKGAGPAPKVEDLGTRMIEGVEATGQRTTRTIAAGEIGNELPIEVVFERWRSEELGVDVMTKRRDPRSAKTTYKLVNIQRTEPLPSLFEPPPDYEVQEPQGDVRIRRRTRSN